MERSIKRLDVSKEVMGRIIILMERMDYIPQYDGITDSTRANSVTQAENKSISRECYLAYLFMYSIGCHCYGKFIKDLENSHNLKQDNYQETLTKTYALIHNY